MSGKRSGKKPSAALNALRRLPAPVARCLLLWSIPTLLLLVLSLAILLPWWQRLAELDQRASRAREQIHDFQRLIATLPRLQAELDAVRNRDDTRAFYLAAATPALAGAELQSQVQDIIRAAGARPVSSQILPADASERPPRVRVRVQFQGTAKSVLDILYRIEAARPFLFIDQVSLRSAANNVPLREINVQRPGQPAFHAQPRHLDDLTLRLDIFGFTLGGDA